MAEYTDPKRARPDQKSADLGILAFTDQRADDIIETARLKLALNFGVTVNGPHVTLRFTDPDGGYVELGMLVTHFRAERALTEHDSDYDK